MFVTTGYCRVVFRKGAGRILPKSFHRLRKRSPLCCAVLRFAVWFCICLVAVVVFHRRMYNLEHLFVSCCVLLALLLGAVVLY